MSIEMILFLGFTFAAGAAIVKVYERSQDVLYGPYFKPDYSQTEQQQLISPSRRRATED
jgi:hypothetical protein